MAISRAQLLKELLPGLNALFGLEYARYGEEHKEIYETETSERSFEEETKLAGFGADREPLHHHRRRQAAQYACRHGAADADLPGHGHRLQELL